MVGSLLNEAIPKLLDLLFPAEAPGPVSLVNYPDQELDSDTDNPDQEGSPGPEVCSSLLAAFFTDNNEDIGDGDDDDEYKDDYDEDQTNQKGDQDPPLPSPCFYLTVTVTYLK